MTPRPYDLQVARQIALLKRHGLTCHVDRRGRVTFRPKEAPR